MRLALFILGGAAAVLAWVLAQRESKHRPIAWALMVYVGASLLRAALLAFVMPPPNPDPAAPPLDGVLRLAVAADRALFLAWPAALAACAVRVLMQRRVWPVAVGYVGVVLAIVLAYPKTRFGVLRQAYLAAELAVLGVGVVSAVTWHRRTWAERRADVAETIALVLVAGHFATVVGGAYRVGLFGEAWVLSQLVYVGILAAVVLLEVAAVAGVVRR